MKHTIRPILVLVAILNILAAQPKPAKPNFSGSWILSSESDPLGGPGTDTPFMRVDHREPQLKVTFSAGSGSAGNDVWSLTTDGAENTNGKNGREVRSHTSWQGDTLVTEWVTGNNIHHRQVWSLSKDGKRLTMVMRDGDQENTVTAVKR